MIEYLFKVVVCSFLFLGFYLLLLQRERMFRFNRIYLLLTLGLSLSTPLFLITLPQKEIPVLPESIYKSDNYLTDSSNLEIKTVQQKEDQLQTRKATVNPQISEKHKNIPQSSGIKINWGFLLIGIYLSVAVIVLFRFLLNFSSIFFKIFRSRKINYQGISLIINDNKEQLYSFWNYIFIPRNNLEENLSRKELLQHEMAHIKQKHSLDILFIELIKILFWFNPAFYFYKKAIQLNHEFLADETVLKTKTDVHEYQKLILNSIQVKQIIPFTSNFNYILTKKRLLMMTQKSNTKKIFLFKLLSLSFLSVMIFIFSNKIYAQEKKIQEQSAKEQAEIPQKPLKIEDQSYQKKDTLPESKNKPIAIKDSKQGKQIDEIAQYYNSSEWKEQEQKIRKQAEETTRYYNSPEWKEQEQQIRKQAEETTRYYNSPEWKEQEQKIKKQTEETARYYNSPEFKKKIEEQLKASTEQAKTAEIMAQKAEQQTFAKYDFTNGDDMKSFKEEMKKFKEDMKALKKELKNIGK